MDFFADVVGSRNRLEFLEVPFLGAAHMPVCLDSDHKPPSTSRHLPNNNEQLTATHCPYNSSSIETLFQSTGNNESICLAMNPYNQRLDDLFDGDPNIL